MLVCLLTSKLFWIPVSGHWDDTVTKEPVSATRMTPSWMERLDSRLE
ncbi:MAG: hypothetical protein O7167_04090 [Wolbachia endosymbiont of Andrena nigroaenea]|nr:hypothetical protein [Wolbachia endosymbiont of Andrena nigroaenea]